jgi:hypothetical protein
MAYLGIKIPENIGTQLVKVNLPGTKEEIINYHITLVYFGQLPPAQGCWLASKHSRHLAD